MSHIEFLTVGFLKKGPEKEIYDSYLKRLNTSLKLIEIDARKHSTQAQWQKELSNHLENKKSYKIFLDEAGKTLTSSQFSKKLEELNFQGHSNISFIIGGADGFSHDFLSNYADYKLSLGAMTFPHMMARVFLIEQIYRAQQISANHPYHRS